MKDNSGLLFLEMIQDMRKYDISHFIGGNPDQMDTFWKTYSIGLNINLHDKGSYEKALIQMLRELYVNSYISDTLDKQNGQNLWTGISITKKGLDYLEKAKKNTVWVKYNNVNGNYEKESKKPTKIKAYKYKKEYHRKLFFKNLLDNIKNFLLKIKFIDFFNKHAGLWGFLALILVIIGWLFFSNSGGIQKNIINNSQNNNIVENLKQVSKGDNNTIIQGNNNTVLQQKSPTTTEEKEFGQWSECETTFRAFIRRINRNDFDYAFSLFDKYLRKIEYFSVENLKNFKQNFVKTNLEIWEINKKFIDNSKFVSRCEFDFKLRYLNKIDGRDRIEMWKGVVLKNKDEVDYFQIGQLKCLDKKCENNPLFN